MDDNLIPNRMSKLEQKITTLEEELNRANKKIAQLSKQNELRNELSISEEKFRLLAEHSRDFDYWIDTKANYKYIAPACEIVSGYSAEEFYNNPKLFIDIIGEDDKERVGEHYYGEHEDDITSQTRMEFQIIHKDGQPRWIEHTCVPIFDSSGNYLGRRGTNRDITKQKKIAKKLAESENTFRSVFYIIPDSISLSRLSDGKYLDINHGFTKISGYTRDEVIGKTALELNVWGNSKRRDLFIKQLKETGEVENFNASFRRKNGKMIVGLMSARIVNLNNVKCLISVVRNITEQEELRNKLKHSEEKFRKIFENHSAVKLLIDSDNGNIVDANIAASKFYQYSIDELKRMNISKINMLPPKKIEVAIEKAKTSQQNFFEFQHRKATGEICAVEVYGSNVEINGKNYIHSVIHDATEKQKALAGIEILSNAVKQSPALIVITDIYGTIEYVNPKFEEVTGFKIEEALGRTPSLLKSGEHTKEFYKEMWDTILSGKEWHGIFRNKKKNGELFWDSAQISPIFDDDGDIVNFVLVAEDITMRIEREKRLRKMEYILNETQEISKIGGWEYKISEERLILTKETYRIYAIPEETKVSIEEVIKYYHEDDREIVLTAFEKCAKDGTPFNLQARLKNAVGKDMIVKTSGKAVRDKADNKTIVKVVGNIADITEAAKTEEALRVSEKKYRIITDATGEVFYELNFENMKYNYIHPNIEKLTGYKPDEFDLSKITIRVERFGEKIDLEKEKIESRSGQHEIFIADYLIKTKDGREIWLADNSFPIYDSDMNIVGAHGVLRDINERKELEADLIKAKNEAVNADKMKDNFLIQMSHEIRTPINTILNMTTLLEEDLRDFLQDNQIGLFEIIRKGGDRIIRTIDLLINLAQITSQTYTPKNEEFDLHASILSRIVKEKKPLSKKNNVNIKLINSVNNSIINLDYFSVNQIFEQIIDNAVKYTKNNDVIITLGKNEENKLFVEVADKGIGIDEEYLPNIFTSFSQEEMGYSRKYDGNGIGLALVKKYCELNNAEITVESKKGFGSIFRVVFN